MMLSSPCRFLLVLSIVGGLLLSSCARPDSAAHEPADLKTPASSTLLPLPVPAEETVTLSTEAMSGEHPRLFFTAAAIPELRAKADREPYRSILQAIRDGAEEDTGASPENTLAWQARLCAFLYTVTGDTGFADRAREKVERIMDGVDPDPVARVWHPSGGIRQLTLSQGSLAVAAAYDLCYDVWPKEFRQRVSEELLAQAEYQIRNWGPGYPDKGAANNWRGIRFSGAGIALLASDEPNRSDTLQTCYEQVVGYLSENLTRDPRSRGFNGEGLGYTMYPWTLIGPFVLALENNTGISIADEVPAVRDTLWTTFLSTVNTPSIRSGEVSRGLRFDFHDDNPGFGAEGHVSLAFAIMRPEYRPALKWFHDDYLTDPDTHAPFDLLRAGTMWTYLFYPEDLAPGDPNVDWGLSFFDPPTGTAFFRNRYRDELDIVTGMTARARGALKQTHHGADINSLRLVGLGTLFATGSGRTTASGGQTTLLDPTNPDKRSDRSAGEVLATDFCPDGSGYIVGRGSAVGLKNHIRRLLVDYERNTTGLPAFLVISDTTDSPEGLWRWNTPDLNTVKVSGNTATITAPNGNYARITAHYPADGTFTTGSYERAGTVTIGSESTSRHHFIQLNGSSAYLVSVQVIERGQEPEPVSTEGDGPFTTLHLKTRNYTPTPEGFEVESATDDNGHSQESTSIPEHSVL